MNPVIRAQLREFSKAHSITAEPEEKQFEIYGIFSVLIGLLGESVEAYDVHLEGDEFGVDGIAVVIQGEAVRNRQEAEDKLALIKGASIEFIFSKLRQALVTITATFRSSLTRFRVFLMASLPVRAAPSMIWLARWKLFMKRAWEREIRRSVATILQAAITRSRRESRSYAAAFVSSLRNETSLRQTPLGSKWWAFEISSNSTELPQVLQRSRLTFLET